MIRSATSQPKDIQSSIPLSIRVSSIALTSVRGGALRSQGQHSDAPDRRRRKQRGVRVRKNPKDSMLAQLRAQKVQ